MGAKKTKSESSVAVLLNGIGFLLAVILVMHTLFVLLDFRSNSELAASVEQAAEPLALFFPGLIEAPGHVLQVLLDYGLAAAFWVLLAGLLARIFGR